LIRWIALLYFTATTSALAVTPPYCAYNIDNKMQATAQTWRFPLVKEEVFDWYTRNAQTPRVTIGDFDDDETPDTAFLIQIGDTPVEVAVCLSQRPDDVVFIKNLYCEDDIGTSMKGSRYYDYERDVHATYELDGIHVGCFEKAGATYLYRNGRFQRIVDSD